MKVSCEFIQDNECQSKKDVLRGLHYQLPPFAQSKLVRVISGSVIDVAVDIRKGSPNYGKHIAIALDSDQKKQLFISRGFAHGFLVTSESAVFAYKVDNYFSAEHDRGLLITTRELVLIGKWNPMTSFSLIKIGLLRYYQKLKFLILISHSIK